MKMMGSSQPGIRSKQIDVAPKIVGVLLFFCAVMFVSTYWIAIFPEVISHLRIDLQPTYFAGRLWAAGEYGAIYQPDVFVTRSTADPAWIALAQKLTPYSRLLETSFVYSPWYLLLTAPLVNAMSYKDFVEFWFALNAFCAAWIGWEAVAWAGITASWKRFLGAILVGLQMPMIYGVWLGQNVAPCLVLVMLGVRCCEGGKWRQVLSGFLFTLAALFKPWAILLIPLLGLSKRWTAFAVAASSCVLLMIGAQLPLFPQDMREDYRQMNQTLLRSTNVAFNNIAVRAFLQREKDDQWGEGIASWKAQAADPGMKVAELAIIAAVAGVALWPMWKRRDDLRVLVAAGLPLILVPLGICWTHYLILLIPALWMMMFGSRTVIPRVVSWAVCVLFLTFPFHDVPVKTHVMMGAPSPAKIRLHPDLWAYWYFFLLMLGVVIALMLLLRRQDATPQDNARSSTP